MSAQDDLLRRPQWGLLTSPSWWLRSSSTQQTCRFPVNTNQAMLWGVDSLVLFSWTLRWVRHNQRPHESHRCEGHLFPARGPSSVEVKVFAAKKAVLTSLSGWRGQWHGTDKRLLALSSSGLGGAVGVRGKPHGPEHHQQTWGSFSCWGFGAYVLSPQVEYLVVVGKCNAWAVLDSDVNEAAVNTIGDKWGNFHRDWIADTKAWLFSWVVR